MRVPQCCGPGLSLNTEEFQFEEKSFPMMPNTGYSDNFHCPEEDPLYSSGRMAVGDYYMRYHLSTEGLLVGSYPGNDGIEMVEHT